MQTPSSKAVSLPTLLLVAAQPGLGQVACWSLICKSAAFTSHRWSKIHLAKPPAFYPDELLQEENGSLNVARPWYFVRLPSCLQPSVISQSINEPLGPNRHAKRFRSVPSYSQNCFLLAKHSLNKTTTCVLSRNDIKSAIVQPCCICCDQIWLYAGAIRQQSAAAARQSK